MSYYRDSVRDDYDDYERPVTIKRYVVGSDDRDDRRDDHRDDLVIRRRTDREEPLEVQRYKREVDYFPPSRRYEDDYYDCKSPVPRNRHIRYISKSLEILDPRQPYGPPANVPEQPVIVSKARQTRESEYDMVRRSDYEDDAYYRRRYDDRRSHRDISPGDSISQASRRHRSDRGRDDYSSDDSMVYVRKETRDYDDEHPHHRRHMAEGALVGMGAAELVRSRSKRDGKEVSHGINHAAKTAGAGALGAVAVNAVSHARDYYRSKSRSRHRSHSFDDDRSSRHHRHRSRGRHSGSRSRSRSHSHSRAKTLLELGVGAAAVAAGVAALRNNNKDKEGRRARSRSRSKSRGRGLSSTRSEKSTTRSEKGNDDDDMSRRRKHMVEAGVAGAALGGIAQYARSRSRSGRHRSQSRIRQALPAVVAGLGTAAATGLYEQNKAKKDGKEKGEGKSRERRHSRSRSRPPSEVYPDPSRDSAGLIEYGNGGVTGSIPADHYYGQPASPGAPYYSDGPRSSRSRSQSRHRGHRSRSRGRYTDSPDESDRERRHSRHGHRSRGGQDQDGASKFVFDMLVL